MPIPASTLNHAGQLLPGLLLVITLLSTPPASAEAPSIEGNYQLLSRTLPRGAALQAPAIMGFLTYTKTHRNSNLLLRDATGKFHSFSTVSTYRLTANEYSETLLFNIVSDQNGGNGLVYEVAGSTQTVPVKIEGARIAFKPPFDPPAFTFEGEGFIATFPDGTVDRWTRLP